MYKKIYGNLQHLFAVFSILAAVVLFESCSSPFLNYGLNQPQESSTLPKSTVPVVPAVRKDKTKITPTLQAAKDSEYILMGWELIEASGLAMNEEDVSLPGVNTDKWYNAVVPGTVLTTLVEEGVYPDPYYGLNNLSIPDSLCRKEWWYRTSFTVPANEIRNDAWLQFDGINYKADIWLNGNLLGKIEGAFKRGIFNAAKYLKDSKVNYLAVHIYPPDNPGIPHEESPTSGRGPNGGVLCLDGPTFISSEGWDWIPGIRDRNIGIWQDVKLKFAGPVTLVDPQVITDLPLPDTTSADISINTEVFNNTGNPEKVIIEGSIENISFKKEVIVNPGKTAIAITPDDFNQLKLKNPRLWWPNGYGNPELYELELKVLAGNKLSDIKTVRFGVREMSYEFTADYSGTNKRIEFNPVNDVKDGVTYFDNINRKDVGNETVIPAIKEDADVSKLKVIEDSQMGPYLVIKVNGQRIFCKGGNWGMDDGMKRVSRERLEPYYKLHRDANYNMIRNWTGESTEEVFYSLADEYGMLVWNDFWMSTEGYNLEPIDKELFLENVKDAVVRFRNHPSIAIWCPRNEGYAPESMEDDIAKIIALNDPTRYYQANSRYMNLTPSGPWDYFNDPADYFRHNAQGFNTELGTPSIPTGNSMKKMMPMEDVWPISDTWYYHDLHWGQKDYLSAINNQYGESKNVDEFCRKAQMINYESHRAMFEAWNSRLWNNTSGLLLWMTHPAWPSTVWQTYSWDYETFGSYFGAKKACEPIHIQMDLHDNKVSIVNTSLKDYSNVTVKLFVYDLTGKGLMSHQTSLNAHANKLTYVFYPELPANLPDVYLVRLLLLDNQGEVISYNDYWKKKIPEGSFMALNSLAPAKLDISVKSVNASEGIMKAEIYNSSETIAVSIKLNLVDEQRIILLPAYFSDGYFNLLPGEKKEVSIFYPDLKEFKGKISAEYYNMNN